MGSTAIRLAAIAAEAGKIVMRHYRAGAGARWKDDRSPVTDADEEAETYILKALADLFPGIPVAAEEAVAAGRACDPCAHFFLVDPLDGTREFLKRNGEFTVNIAEVRGGVPVAGTVYAPVISKLFFGDADGAFEVKAAPGKAIGKQAARRIHVRTPPAKGWVAATSRSHPDPKTDEFLKRFSIGRTIVAGSSLKFCLVAAGDADIYARAGRTMEWDTAAGHAVLAAAGGTVTRWDGAPFLYGKPGFENGGFVARAL
ncbi:MAG TPA: 3'(2'),5'-bisphosphate nucleotidase CysQ [Rhizomicrobium sp.]|jgi:3'(2'), 5'-bisphosphate nucleotidase|nr:3'(2'),5'-bisphosphate nucleotidase CysQ [Rhizomicrobium sp.]